MKINEMSSCVPFEQIKALDSDGYSTAFGDIDPAILDSRFVNAYGNRTVSPVTVDDTGAFRSLAIAYVWALHKRKWTRYNELFGLSYDVMTPYSMNITMNRTFIADDKTTQTGDELNKVNGFDSETSVDDTSRVTNDTTNDKRNQNTVTTRTTTGNNSGRMLSNLVQGDIDLHRQMFFDIVLSDMKAELTLSIYE